jgi:hypothetical protein
MNSTNKKLQKIEKKLKTLEDCNEVISSEIISSYPDKEVVKSHFRAIDEMIDTRLEILNEMKKFKYDEADCVTNPGRYEGLYYTSLYLCLLIFEEDFFLGEYNKLSSIDKFIFDEEFDLMNEFMVKQNDYGFFSVYIYP